jgi:hypothetical protein
MLSPSAKITKLDRVYGDRTFDFEIAYNLM